MNDYIKNIRINSWVTETLLTRGQDRLLGDFITFELVNHPNTPISAYKTLVWFKHIVFLLGYTYEHIQEREFGEMAECWIYASSEYDKVRVVHKYWSLKQCQLCIDLVKTLSEFHRIPIEYYRG